ncbi:CPBP family intramembrane glutamic endopeptidase [Caproiciproducens faecalis]|uniref:CPBP family intramembrane metalloprotease n=1 Tax=Caproiciproducens faecalis TaxID=2820301 RepID=A0ABS7DNU8_9FIRM|nr:type II CAAX endopeptidase family protein [Caproiciproducens faecalis]MBW7572789.1 CPBP family intramembrane metalloprotease [Caproiciproducens faecalis]
MNESPDTRYGPYYPVHPFVEAQNRKRELRKTSNAVCWTLLLAMFLMTGFLYICVAYLKAVGYTGDYSNSGFSGFTPVLYYLANGAGYLVGLAAPALVFFAARHISLNDALPFEKAGFLKICACAFFGTAVCMLANIPANAVAEMEKWFGFSGELPEMPLTGDFPVLTLYFLTIAVIPPLVEELFFRGVVLHSLRKYGDGFAVVGSAILFGLYHGNFVQMVFAFLAGLVMALVVVRTNSLWPSIMIHFFNNGISFVVEMSQRFGGDQMENYVNNSIVVVFLVLGAVSLVYLAITDKKFFRGETVNPYFRLSAKLNALFLNPGGVAVLLFAVLSSFRYLTQY